MANVPVLRHYAEVMDDHARMLDELRAVLVEVGSAHTLVGGLAVGHHGRQRATIDVDLLVPSATLEDLSTALERRGYRVKRTADMVRVYSPSASETDEAIADLVGKDAHPVLAAAFDEADDASVLGQKVRVVRRGALVALKFHAAVSPTRKHADRLQDIVDIERIITNRFDEGDRTLAMRIAALSFSNGERDLAKLIDDLQNGRPVTV